MSKSREKLFSLVLLLAIFFKALIANDELNLILDGIFQKQEKMNREISDVTFDVYYTYLETKDNNKIEKSIKAWRRVFMQEFENQQHKFLAMIENNRRLNPAEMEKNIREWRKYEKMIKNTKLPFNPKFSAYYNYYLSDSINYDTGKVWKIGFKPKRQKAGLVQGFAYILKQDTNVIQLNFVPVKLPAILRNFKIQIDYSKQNSLWLPNKFSLEMEVIIKIIATLYKRNIYIQEEYYNYQFNQGIDVFELK
jgi:hypothetical protein